MPEMSARDLVEESLVDAFYDRVPSCGGAVPWAVLTTPEGGYTRQDMERGARSLIAAGRARVDPVGQGLVMGDRMVILVPAPSPDRRKYRHIKV